MTPHFQPRFRFAVWFADGVKKTHSRQTGKPTSQKRIQTSDSIGFAGSPRYSANHIKPVVCRVSPLFRVGNRRTGRFGFISEGENIMDFDSYKLTCTCGSTVELPAGPPNVTARATADAGHLSRLNGAQAARRTSLAMRLSCWPKLTRRIWSAQPDGAQGEVHRHLDRRTLCNAVRPSMAGQLIRMCTWRQQTKCRPLPFVVRAVRGVARQGKS